MPRGSQVLLEYHDHIELDGYGYGIRNNHRDYIVALKILRAKEILEEDKAQAVLPLLFSEPIPKGKEVEAIEAYFELFVSDKRKSNAPASFDIIQDADYIYAGFIQAYGIDLDSEETELKVEQFIALIKGLPSTTKLGDIIRIRTMPVPEPTKFNAKQRADIIEAKATFALEGESLGKSWSNFGRAIKEWARHGK